MVMPRWRLPMPWIISDTGQAECLTFDTASGPLYVTRDGDRYRIEFPAVFMDEVDTPDEVAAALGVPVVRSFRPSNGAWQMVCELVDEATLKPAPPTFLRSRWPLTSA